MICGFFHDGKELNWIRMAKWLRKQQTGRIIRKFNCSVAWKEKSLVENNAIEK